MKALAIVTGGSSGLGAEVANMFIAKDIFTVVVSRQAKEKFKANSEFYRALNYDLSKSEEILKFLSELNLSEAVDELYLVNNAMYASPFEDLGNVTDQTLENTHNLGLLLPIKLVQHYYRLFSKLKKLRIINIGSFLSYEGAAQSVIYSTYKHAMLGFTRSLALEIAHLENATCNMISPGYLDTEMMSKNPNYQDLKKSDRLTKIDSVLKAIDTLISNKNINGKNLSVVGNRSVEIT